MLEFEHVARHRLGANALVTDEGQPVLEVSATRIKGGGQLDSVEIAAGSNAAVLTDCLVGNDLIITAGNGDDIVQLNGTNTIGGNTLINLGGGNNSQP